MTEHFSSVPIDIEDDSDRIWPYVKAFIVCIIACVIDTDISTTSCYLMYLPLLKDVDTINSYSWGSDMVASLISPLRHMREKKTKTIGGFNSVLATFFLIRISRLANSLLSGTPSDTLSILDDENIQRTLEFPLIGSFMKFMNNIFKNS
ncbi:uncharacterized protein LOC133783820 [Humulus lupulus]|uniref:uncharacterized protein LOC133783820 n=1 Tax=Humulus lupulus TaxID=3486 RepID=UPI002B415D89|nr:uncharacterized protein LOC133783820 [Humulus lupulus]